METHIKWRVNDIIRNKATGHPYLVLHVSRYYCSIVDLNTQDPLSPTWTLLQRDFDKYASDEDMEAIKKKDEMLEERIIDWEYNHIVITP